MALVIVKTRAVSNYSEEIKTQFNLQHARYSLMLAGKRNLFKMSIIILNRQSTLMKNKKPSQASRKVFLLKLWMAERLRPIKNEFPIWPHERVLIEYVSRNDPLLAMFLRAILMRWPHQTKKFPLTRYSIEIEVLVAKQIWIMIYQSQLKIGKIMTARLRHKLISTK